MAVDSLKLGYARNRAGTDAGGIGGILEFFEIGDDRLRVEFLAVGEGNIVAQLERIGPAIFGNAVARCKPGYISAVRASSDS